MLVFAMHFIVKRPQQKCPWSDKCQHHLTPQFQSAPATCDTFFFPFLVLTRRCLRALPTLPVTAGSQVSSQSCSVTTAKVYGGQTAYSDRTRNSVAKQFFFPCQTRKKNTFHDLRHSNETILANDSWLFIKK